MKKPQREGVRRLAAAVAVLGVMSGAGVAAQPALQSAKPLQASGTIVSADPWKKLVRVEEKRLGLFPTGAPKDFVVNAETAISDRSRQQSLRFHDLVDGASVKIEYAVENGKNVARSIIVRRSPSEMPPQAQQPPSQPTEGTPEHAPSPEPSPGP